MSSFRHKIIAALQECVEYYEANPIPVTSGSRPTCRGKAISQASYDRWRDTLDSEKRADAPAPKSIRFEFGSWNNAVEAAGIVSNTAPRATYANVGNGTDPEMARVAIQEWLRFLRAHDNCAPRNWHLTGWSYSQAEYQAWRSSVAPAAPNVGFIRGTLGDFSAAVDNAHKWPKPTKQQRAALYSAKSSRGDLLHARDSGSITLSVQLEDVPDCTPATIQLDSRATWDDLHLAIQAAMGWENYHLYSFKHKVWEFPNPKVWAELDPTALEEIELNGSATAYLAKGTTFTYTYDFGDNWWHTVTVTGVSSKPVSGGAAWAVVQAATGTPYEDSGGPWGWRHLNEAAADASDPEHEHAIEWLGRTCEAPKCAVKHTYF